jgi:trimethylamine--corrinoid protein Co-methyltransferase
MLHPEQCETVHLASLEILRRTGVRLHHPEALRLLEEANASISDGNLVRFPPSLVEWALDQAPSRVVLCPRRSSEPALRLEGRESFFGPGSDCPNYLDPRSGERRPYNTADIIDSIRVVDALPEMDFCMSMGIPSDLPSPNPYRHQFALMLAHTTKPSVFVCDDRADCEAIVAMAAAVAGDEAALHLNPNLLLYSEPSTPLQHSATATDKLLFMAGKGLPVVHSPAPMMGGTAPMSVAGALALGNAEVLSALVVQQLKRRGAPFVYGVQVHHMDMRTMISVYGAPEYQLARVMNAEMARYYRLPSWGNAGMTDSCVLDEQAATDVLFSVLVALLSGTNLVHDAGYMEAGLTTSPELVVLTAEAIAMARHFASGVELSPEALALEVIHEVGAGGDFLTQQHTLRHMRDFWQPGLISRQRMSDWVASGRKRLGARLADRTRAILDEHRAAPLPDGVQAEIDYILTSV